MNMNMKQHMPVLEHIRKLIAGTLRESDRSHMRYPTAISQTLGMHIVEIGQGLATVSMDADAARHGNQQGTVHGGLIAELADAAIGTAHSTTLLEDESFTSIELRVNYFRPVWRSNLHAIARPVQSGRTISHYTCDILQEDGRPVAQAGGVIMTLRGDMARGR